MYFFMKTNPWRLEFEHKTWRGKKATSLNLKIFSSWIRDSRKEVFQKSGHQIKPLYNIEKTNYLIINSIKTIFLLRGTNLTYNHNSNNNNKNYITKNKGNNNNKTITITITITIKITITITIAIKITLTITITITI